MNDYVNEDLCTLMILFLLARVYLLVAGAPPCRTKQCRALLVNTCVYATRACMARVRPYKRVVSRWFVYVACVIGMSCLCM